MLEILKTVTASPEQWEIIIEGMRNPMNSWKNMDSVIDGEEFLLGNVDEHRMMSLAKGGSVHAKYRRMIPVWCTINAPLYWWKEFETYRTGVAPNPTDIELNSCSTMHKVTEKEFAMDDFSTEHMLPDTKAGLQRDIDDLNYFGCQYLDYKAKKNDILAEERWWQIIQRLPSSYNQRRTMFTNYEALSAMYEWRHNHKLDEWKTLCKWMETLPHSEIITLKEVTKDAGESAGEYASAETLGTISCLA